MLSKNCAVGTDNHATQFAQFARGHVVDCMPRQISQEFKHRAVYKIGLR